MVTDDNEVFIHPPGELGGSTSVPDPRAIVGSLLLKHLERRWAPGGLKRGAHSKKYLTVGCFDVRCRPFWIEPDEPDDGKWQCPACKRRIVSYKEFRRHRQRRCKARR